MVADILTVMWKEWRGLFRQSGGRGLAAASFPAILLMAVVFPWLTGIDWLEDPLSLAACVLIPTLFAVLVVPDSFAGERERHTLPTLLSSRLSDRAILLGKMGVPVILGLAVTWTVLIVGWLTVNIVHWDGQVVLYTPTIALADIALSVLMASLASAAGVLFSLRAATAQDAMQSLTVALMVPGVALAGTGAIAGAALGPRLRDVLSNLEFAQVMLFAVAVIALLDVVVLMAAAARFRRDRLILD